MGTENWTIEQWEHAADESAGGWFWSELVEKCKAAEALAKTNEERWLGAAAECTTERDAHELEKRERERNWQERNEARARVAELERELDAKHAKLVEVADKLRAERAAVDQARGLLTMWLAAMNGPYNSDRVSETEAWLRDNPAPATPAATGAERCGTPTTPCGNCDWCAKMKEQGTDIESLIDRLDEALHTLLHLHEHGLALVPAADVQAAKEEKGG